MALLDGVFSGEQGVAAILANMLAGNALVICPGEQGAYPVQNGTVGELVVNVPWTDTNTISTGANLSVTTAAFGQTIVHGSATTFARSDHSHPLPAAPTWDQVTGKPTTFTPSAHSHDYASSTHTHTAPTWDQVTGKPTTFNPATHSHDYASSTHTHNASTITAGTFGGTTAYTFPQNVNITGNLLLKGAGNYGNKINFGDGDYVHLYEITDDCLQIKASSYNFLASTIVIATANTNGFVFYGTPTAPTATAGTNTTQLATTAFVTTAVAGKANTGHIHTEYASAGHGHTAANIGAMPFTQASSLSLDTLRTPGCYTGTFTYPPISVPIGATANGSCIVQQTTWNNTAFVNQIFIAQDTSPVTIYFRSTNSATTWSSWRIIATLDTIGLGTVAIALGTTESTTKFSTGSIFNALSTWITQIGQKINGIITSLGNKQDKCWVGTQAQYNVASGIANDTIIMIRDP